MLNNNLKHHPGTVVGTKTRFARAVVSCLFGAASVTVNAQTNWINGTAYGSNDLSEAVSIASAQNGPGSLIVGFSETDSLSLDHDIQGFIVISNEAVDFSINATTNAVVTSPEGAAITVLNATNLTITGGRFVGEAGQSTGAFPLIPGGSGSSAVGGLLRNSTATLVGTAFVGADGPAGADGLAGLVIDTSDVTISNGTFIGGSGVTGGSGLLAVSNSAVVIHGGSFTGLVNNTAFYLQDSDARVNGGSFTGNVGGESGTVYGDGLFSELTAATTNSVELHGGTFSSLAFWGVDGSVQNLFVGTNLVVHNGIVQSGGTVFVNNQSDAALQDITILDGIMQMQNDFTLSSNGVITLFISAETNSMFAANTVTFESNATLNIDATLARFSSGTNTVKLIGTAAGISNTNNLIVNVDTIGRITYIGLNLAGGNNLEADFAAQALKDYWNATGPFAPLAEELDALLPDEMDVAINLINDPDASGKLVEQTYFTTFNNFQTALQGMRAAVGQSVSRGSVFREQLKLMPLGARGPELNNNLRGWVKYYGQYYTHDREQLNPEYDATLHGGVAGIDTSMGNLLIGVSGGSSHYRISYDPSARSDTVAYHGNIYATHGFDRGYLDAGIFYGQHQVDTRTADPFSLEGSFDADVAGGYLGGGYDLVDLDGETIFTPEGSLHYAMYEQDGYTETGSAAVPRKIDAYDADSMLSSLGMNVSMLNDKKQDTVRYKADLRLHWMHEFNPDPSNMKFMLQGGSNTYPLTYPSLDEDLFRVGIGCTFFNTLAHQPRNVMFRIDFDELFGDGFNSHNLSAKVIYAF